MNSGGAPGEDVATYLKNCPRINFIGLNLYVNPNTTVGQFREDLLRYKIGRNIPSLTETNSANDGVAPRLVFLSVGEFGSPLFSPWALNISTAPYVTGNGTLANGAFALRDAYTALAEALPQIAYFAGTDKLKVFMADSPGKKFSETQDVNGLTVTVSGENEAKAIAIHPGGHNLLLVGNACEVAVKDVGLQWPEMKSLRVERGHWEKNVWVKDGEPVGGYEVDQSHGSLWIDMQTPETVRISW